MARTTNYVVNVYGHEVILFSWSREGYDPIVSLGFKTTINEQPGGGGSYLAYLSPAEAVALGTALIQAADDKEG